MTVKKRLRICSLIDSIDNNKEYADKIGIYNNSTFYEKSVNNSPIPETE